MRVLRRRTFGGTGKSQPRIVRINTDQDSRRPDEKGDGRDPAGVPSRKPTTRPTGSRPSAEAAKLRDTRNFGQRNFCLRKLAGVGQIEVKVPTLTSRRRDIGLGGTTAVQPPHFSPHGVKSPASSRLVNVQECVLRGSVLHPKKRCGALLRLDGRAPVPTRASPTSGRCSTEPRHG